MLVTSEVKVLYIYIYKINIDVYHKHSSLNAMNMANTFSECSLAFKTWMIWPSPTLFSVHPCIDTCSQHLEVADESSQSNTWQADNNTCRKVLPDTRMSQKPGGKPFHQLTRRKRVCEVRLRVFLPHRLFIAHVNQCELKLLFSCFLFSLFLF